MASSPFKNVIVVGATGTIGAPITKALLSSGLFSVSALSRPESKAVFPDGVTVKRADPTSHAELVAAFKGYDAVVVTLNDAAAELEPKLIEAAYEAGVKRLLPNEWAAHELNVLGTPLEDVLAGKAAVVDLLNEKSKQAKEAGREFYWTGVNNGTFFDWALYASFIDISLPPNNVATLWDGGNKPTTLTTLSSVAKSVVSVLTTAEVETRNTLVNVSSTTATQLEIVAALEKATGERWVISHTTREEQLKVADDTLKSGDFLNAFYGWIKAAIWSGEAVLADTEKWNKVVGLETTTLDEIIGKIIKGEQV